MAFRLRSWFYEVTRQGSLRGTRFNNGDRPPKETFNDFTDSALFRSDPNDRAKEDDGTFTLIETNGHVVAATDAQVKAGQAKKNDRTLVVQPSQVPEVHSYDTITIASANVPLTDEALLDITPDAGNDEKNDYIVTFTTPFKTWLQDLVTWVETQIDALTVSLGDLISDYNSTKAQVIQNTADILLLSPGGAPAVVPVGATFQWMVNSAPPSTFHLLQGQELEVASNPLLYAVLGTVYNNGTETPGYFRLPDMRDRLPRGFNPGTKIGWTGPLGSGGTTQTIGLKYGDDLKYLSKDEIPVHTHRVTGTTTDAGAHSHTFTGQNGSNVRDNNDGDYVVENNNKVGGFKAFTDKLSSEPDHSHSFDVTSAGNTSLQYPFERIPQVLLVNYIIKGD